MKVRLQPVPVGSPDAEKDTEQVAAYVTDWLSCVGTLMLPLDGDGA